MEQLSKECPVRQNKEPRHPEAFRQTGAKKLVFGKFEVELDDLDRKSGVDRIKCVGVVAEWDVLDRTRKCQCSE